MTLPQDPNILVSVVNMKLRDDYTDLDDLCASLDVDRSDLESRLRNAGFTYNPQTHQFI